LIYLPDEHCDEFKHLDDWKVEERLMVAFFAQLKAKEIKCLILDEAQKNLELVEFLVKSPGADRLGTCRFIISGTPPCGTNNVDYGGSISARTAPMALSTLRGYEVRAFLNASFNETISILCWLDFWTIFNGEPGLYQQIATLLNPMEPEKKKRFQFLEYMMGSFQLLMSAMRSSETTKI
jgi:hypothetical protein